MFELNGPTLGLFEPGGDTGPELLAGLGVDLLKRHDILLQLFFVLPLASPKSFAIVEKEG
jgi:hypothetical protein